MPHINNPHSICSSMPVMIPENTFNMLYICYIENFLSDFLWLVENQRVVWDYSQIRNNFPLSGNISMSLIEN